MNGYVTFTTLNVAIAVILLCFGLAGLKYPALAKRMVPIIAIAWALMALFGYARGFFLWEAVKG